MNRTAIITGGAKLLGAAMAVALANEGWDIALHYNTSSEEAASLSKRIEALGKSCKRFQADFNRMKDVRALLPSVLAEMQDVDVLINSVSIFGRARMVETTEDIFDSHFQVNLKAPFFLSQAFAAHCGKGHIINLLDTRIAKNTVQYFAYGLTKKALLAFTEMAAVELGPSIRVNAVAPGLILPSAGTNSGTFENMGKKIPAHATGHPDDIVSAVLFLLKSRFITGECIFVDGGEKLL